MKLDVMIPRQWVSKLEAASLKSHRSPSGEVLAAVERHLADLFGSVPEVTLAERSKIDEGRVGRRVLNLCSGTDGETEGVIVNRCRDVGKGEMADLLAGLVKRGNLRAEVSTGRGRPTVRYFTV